MHAENVVFIIILAAAGVVFARRVSQLIAYLRVGRPDHRLSRVRERIRQTLVVGFGQSKILRDPVAGPIHAAIFWGFLILLGSALEMILDGLHRGWSLNFLGPLYSVLTGLTDVFCVLVIIGTVTALWRRYVSRVRRLQVGGEQLEAGLILVLIFTIVTALLLQSASRPYATGAEPSHAFHPLAGPLGEVLFRGGDPFSASLVFGISWWTHALLILGFLNYLPYSKHLHVLTSIPNVFFSSVGLPNALDRIDFEAEGVEKFGVVDIEDLSWKSLLDGYTCTHCGRCTSACPANATGKVLDPRGIIMSIHERTLDRAPLLIKKKRGLELTAAEQTVWEKKLIGDYVSPDALWACTTCGACMQECPVNIEHVPAIVGMRRSMVLMESSFNDESVFLPRVYGNMETNAVPWSFAQADRANWAEGMGIKTAAEDAEMEVLFWVGCAGSYDERAKKVTRAFAELMQLAGVNFRILGTEESCTGDVARRTGNEYLADALTRSNVETFTRYRVSKVVTTCPHCFNTLAGDYRAYGFSGEVIHHTQFIADLIAQGRLDLTRAPSVTSDAVAYHDSCYLGRYNGEYRAPRDALAAVPGLTVREPARTGDRGFCCGAGGGRMFMEERVGDRVNIVRTRELMATGAKTIAVNCPFCSTMITDGVKAAEGADNVAVKDVSEIVLERVRR